MMKRGLWGMLVALWLLPAIAAAQAAPEWSEFKSEPGKFSISLPGKPQEAKQTVQTKLGPLVATNYQLAVGEGAFVIAFVDYPSDQIKGANPQKLLDGARDGAATNVNGKILKEKKIKIGKHPGREVTIEANPPQAPGMVLEIQGRLYMVGDRLYQVLALAPKGKMAKADVKKLFDSFKLL